MIYFLICFCFYFRCTTMIVCRVVLCNFLLNNCRFVNSFVLATSVKFTVNIIRGKKFIAVITCQCNTFQDFVLICFGAVVSYDCHFWVFVPIHFGNFLYISRCFNCAFTHSAVSVNLYGFSFSIFYLGFTTRKRSRCNAKHHWYFIERCHFTWI